ncbi:MAG: hypothetical protein ABSE49_28785, partial [Polyangiaceae bacterium]
MRTISSSSHARWPILASIAAVVAGCSAGSTSAGEQPNVDPASSSGSGSSGGGGTASGSGSGSSSSGGGAPAEAGSPCTAADLVGQGVCGTGEACDVERHSMTFTTDESDAGTSEEGGSGTGGGGGG